MSQRAKIDADTTCGEPAHDDYQRRNKLGRQYAETVLKDLRAKGFPGGLLHKADEIEDSAVRAGFYAFVGELAIKSLS
jgi:hypothetical protein